MRVIKKISGALDITLITVAAVMFLAMLTFSTLQVISRYIFRYSLTWSEEYSRFLFIHIVMYGSALLVRRRGHVMVSLFVNKLRFNAKYFLSLFVIVLCCVFFIIITYYGYFAMLRAATQYSAATLTNMGLVYVSLPISGVLMLFFGIEILIDTILAGPKNFIFGMGSEE